MASVTKCLLCKKEFPNRNKMMRHFEAMHKCKWCKLEVKDKDEMKNHFSTCENYLLFLHRCEHCGKVDKHKGHHDRYVAICKAKKLKCSSVEFVL